MVRVIEKLKGRKRKAADRGVRLKYLHRYVSDHKISHARRSVLVVAQC